MSLSGVLLAAQLFMDKVNSFLNRPTPADAEDGDADADDDERSASVSGDSNADDGIGDEARGDDKNDTPD